MTRHEHEADLVDLLRRVDAATEVPPADVEREAALMSAFDAAHRDDAATGIAPRLNAARDCHRLGDVIRRTRRLAMAAAIILTVAAAAMWYRTPDTVAPRAPTPTVAAAEFTDFVPWPGASALPRFESGQLVRIDLPASMLPSLGLFPPASDAGVVRADVLIGQDGLARAVRLLPPTTEKEGSP